MASNAKTADDLEISYEKVADLVPYARNAKKHDAMQVRQIANSIEAFGMNDPIAVWTNGDGELEIVEGHGRALALEQLGVEDAPVIRLDHMTDEERRAYTHAHNQLTLVSGFDEDMLFEDMDELDFEWEDFGFDLPEEEAGTYTEIEEDEVDEDVEGRVQEGEVWLLGDHRLMCGDSTDMEAVEKLMGGVRADMFLTDPPYNVSYVGKTEDALTIENDTMEDTEFRQFLVDAFSAADAVLNPGAAIYVWHADSEGYNFRGAFHDVGWPVKETLIWVKNTMVLGRQDYQWKHEPVLYTWKPGASHNWYSDRKQTTVLEFDKPARNAEHPTMKPVALFAYQMENSSKKGDVILDLFGGSGTTIIAAEQLGRRGYCMELDPKYASVIVNRWEKLTGRTAIKEVEE